jgi:hypothetical protein
MKLCKDCRHAEMQSGIWFCMHPSAMRPTSIDPVTGEPVLARGTSCDFARILIHNADGEDLCGREGKFWEPAAPPGFV